MGNNKHKSRSSLLSGLDKAATEILPICTNNICTVREQIEAAITGLLDNFSQLASLINQSNQISSDSTSKSALTRLQLSQSDIAQSAAQLQDIFAELYPILIKTKNDKALALVSQAFLRTVDIRQTSQSCQTLVTGLQQNDNNAEAPNPKDAMNQLLSEMIVALQFQDRISQILGGVEKTLVDLAGITSILSAGKDERMDIDIDIDLVLREMRNRYVTPEQKANDSHFKDAPTKTAGNGGDITFF